MSRTIEFFFDYGSPFSYLADAVLPDLVTRTGATVTFRPMLLGGVFKATGNQTPVNIKPKGKWMFFDMANYARKYGVPMQMNPYFIFNSMPLMRGALVAQRRDEIEAYTDAVFYAIWRDAKNLGDPAIIGETLTENGFDAQAYLDGIQQPEIKQALIDNTEEAVARGVFGAPTFFVGDKMWWGQDRLDWVEQELAA